MTEVAYLGPAGTFTHQAVRALDPDSTHVALTTGADVVRAVQDGSVTRGVIPIDNSIEGPVAPSFDALLSSTLYITGMTAVPISFTAYRASGAGQEPARIVRSHPHALAQCAEFIRLRGLESRAAPSTAAACAEIRADEIALAPAICGELYDVVAVEEDVQDFGHGYTRFAQVSTADDARSNPGLEQADRTVVTVVPNSNGRGVLARIATTFAESGYDLQGLVLRPLKTPDFRYVFIFTVAANPHDTSLIACLSSLTSQGDRVRMLGYYAAGPELPSDVDPTGPLLGAATVDELAASLLFEGR